MPARARDDAAAVFQAYLHGGLAAVAESAYDDVEGRKKKARRAPPRRETLPHRPDRARRADATLPLLRQALDAKKRALAA